MSTTYKKIIRTTLACAALLLAVQGATSQTESRHMRVFSQSGIAADYPVAAIDSVKYPMLDTRKELAINLDGASSLEEIAGQYYLPAVERLVVSGNVTAADLKYIADNLTALRSLNLAAATTADGTLPDGAMQSATGLHALRSLTLPDAATAIGANAFPGILSLERVDLPQTTAELGAAAFAGCVSMTELTIPASLSKIGDETFAGCASLGRVTIDATTPPTLGNDAFTGIRKRAALIVPLGSGRRYVESDWSLYFKIYEQGYEDTEIPATVLSDDFITFALDRYEDVRVDKQNNFITVKVPYGIIQSAMTPWFSLRNGLTASAGGEKVVSGETKLDFTKPVKFTLTDTNGNTTDYIVAVCYSDMPMVYINTAGAAEIASREEYVAIDDLYIMNSDYNGLYAKARIKGRGNSSWGMPKKSYTMKLDKKAAFMGMKKHKTFALVGNYSDKTLLRNSFIYEMGRKIFDGMTWNPSTVQVHLVVNGEYYGVYQLCETNKIDANRVNIPNIEDCKSIEDAPNYGFLLEANRRMDEYFNFETPRLAFSLKDPDGEDISEELQQYIKDKTYNTELSLFSRGYNDPTSPKWYANNFDRDSFIDWLILNELSKNNDSKFFSSCYMYYDPADAKFHMGPLWDYDLACGNIDYNDCDTVEDWIIAKMFWYKQMLKIPDFNDAFKARFAEVKDRLREYINVEIPRQCKEMEPDAQINFKRWPILGKYIWPNAPGYENRLTYQSEVDYIVDWLNRRLDWMEGAVSTIGE